MSLKRWSSPRGTSVLRHLALDGGNCRVTNPYYRGSVENRADEFAAVDRDSIQHGVKRAVVDHVSSKAGGETPKLGEELWAMSFFEGEASCLVESQGRCRHPS